MFRRSRSASGSISQRHGSANPNPHPDPHQNVMDPQHWLCLWILGSITFLDPWYHGRRNYKDTTVNVVIYWCLIEFIDWRYSQSCWYFWPLVNCYPSTFSLTSQSKCTVYTDSIWGGVELCCRPYFLQEFNTLFLTRFRTYKIEKHQ